MRSKRPTLRDVAREANVSYQTVSRVINDHVSVSPLTRTRVQKAIDTLGFRPNRAAQIMQTERSHTIEVILFYAGFNNFLYEMARASQRLGYHFSISAITEEEFIPTLESAASRFVDGLILLPLTRGIEDYETLTQLTDGTPFVQISGKTGSNLPSVMYDQMHGARLAAQHLIDLGHRQLAEISGPLDNYDGGDRHEGWVSTLKNYGLDTSLSVEGDFNIQSGYQAMNRLLDTGAHFTAVFVGNDSMAFGAHTALRERGLRVPEDVSIVGFDDIPEAAHFVPGLTTIRQDFELIGRLAVEFLVNMIENPGTPVHQRVLQPRLVVRGSTQALT
ncbi:MAG: LacI family transcriptional regulator [Chloroflexi bacterium]|nr:LacI family transcriptional regulator [Chloroflexota bacterium]MCC6892208.1 LacI family DNA-binding transcriptional regulator [Anaerolineae bacterium]